MRSALGVPITRAASAFAVRATVASASAISDARRTAQDGTPVEAGLQAGTAACRRNVHAPAPSPAAARLPRARRGMRWQIEDREGREGRFDRVPRGRLQERLE